VTAVLAGAAGLAVVRRRRARPSPSVEADLAALTAALRRLGWSVPEATTLSALERRLAAVAGPEAAGEVRRLRERRYGQRGDRAAHRLDRRALRRALGAGRGPLGRLRALAALPPAAR
jgi:hypothetical protein